jgi:hypothetical protein
MIDGGYEPFRHSHEKFVRLRFHNGASSRATLSRRYDHIELLLVSQTGSDNALLCLISGRRDRGRILVARLVSVLIYSTLICKSHVHASPLSNHSSSITDASSRAVGQTDSRRLGVTSVRYGNMAPSSGSNGPPLPNEPALLFSWQCRAPGWNAIIEFNYFRRP